MELLVLVASTPRIPEVVEPEVVYLSVPRIPRVSSLSYCLLDEGQELLVFAVKHFPAAAGDVAVVGYRRWWRDVYVICRRGVVQCWVLQSSITCFAYCFLSPPIRGPFFAATSLVRLFLDHYFE